MKRRSTSSESSPAKKKPSIDEQRSKALKYYEEVLKKKATPKKPSISDTSVINPTPIKSAATTLAEGELTPPRSTRGRKKSTPSTSSVAAKSTSSTHIPLPTPLDDFKLLDDEYEGQLSFDEEDIADRIVNPSKNLVPSSPLTVPIASTSIHTTAHASSSSSSTIPQSPFSRTNSSAPAPSSSTARTPSRSTLASTTLTPRRLPPIKEEDSNLSSSAIKKKIKEENSAAYIAKQVLSEVQETYIHVPSDHIVSNRAPHLVAQPIERDLQIEDMDGAENVEIKYEKKEINNLIWRIFTIIFFSLFIFFASINWKYGIYSLIFTPTIFLLRRSFSSDSSSNSSSHSSALHKKKTK